MAKAKKKRSIDEIANGMIERLNKKLGKGKQICFSLNDGVDPAKIDRWYSTRSILLDSIMSGNRAEGGAPGGRYVEIAGAESIGKSHICYQMARDVLESGGVVMYIDTELATSIENLKALGVDVESNRFTYSKVDSIEGVFEVAEEYLKEWQELWKEVPIAIFWDSIGGIGSRKEVVRAYDDEQMVGLNAKQITMCLRKFTPHLNESGASFNMVNQEYDVIGANMYTSEKTKTKGGSGVRYWSSIRIGLSKVRDVYPEDIKKSEARDKGVPACGIRVRAKTRKNKIAAPHRVVEFDIHFGVGIKEHMPIWEMFIDQVDGITVGDKIYIFKGGAYKTIETFDASTGESLNKDSFRQKNIEEKLMVEHFETITKPCLSKIMGTIMDRSNKEASEYDPDTDDADEGEDSEENIMKELDV